MASREIGHKQPLRYAGIAQVADDGKYNPVVHIYNGDELVARHVDHDVSVPTERNAEFIAESKIRAMQELERKLLADNAANRREGPFIKAMAEKRKASRIRQ